MHTKSSWEFYNLRSVLCNFRIFCNVKYPMINMHSACKNSKFVVLAQHCTAYMQRIMWISNSERYFHSYQYHLQVLLVREVKLHEGWQRMAKQKTLPVFTHNRSHWHVFSQSLRFFPNIPRKSYHVAFQKMSYRQIRVSWTSVSNVSGPFLNIQS
jgi:hypothetical protein